MKWDGTRAILLLVALCDRTRYQGSDWTLRLSFTGFPIVVPQNLIRAEGDAGSRNGPVL